MRTTLAMALALGLLWQAAPSPAFEVFQDPTDNGANGGTATVTIGAPAVPLNLYVAHGTNPSDPNVACSGTGPGDEFCAWDIRIVTTGLMALGTFVAEQPGTDYVVSNATPSELRANGGDPIVGESGAKKWGTLMVSATGPGTVEVVGSDSLVVTAALTTAPIPGTVLASAGTTDTDGDGIDDVDDNCPFVANADQLDRGGVNTSVADGTGDACQCGDPCLSLPFSDRRRIAVSEQP